MFGRVWEQIKEHKFVVMALVAGVIFLIWMRGGTSAGAAQVDPNASAGDNTLQAAQLDAQTQMHNTDVQGAAAQAQIAAGGHAADLAYQLQSDANNLQANIASTQMADTLQALTTHDTLQAQVANHTIDAGLQVAQIQGATSTTNTRVLANAAVKQAQVTSAAAVQAQQAKSCAWYNPTCW
jgi:hypothetical protein